jgi:hypothetical protein
LIQAGITEPCIFSNRMCQVPGYFRPEMRWDLLVIVDGKLLASIEFKSHVGSFGNLYNNRTEEALDSATDLWTAYREGAFAPSKRPWLGYLMLLEDAPRSMTPVRPVEPHFPVFEEFRDASYAKRYELLLTRLMRERLYDATCLLLSKQKTGLRGAYTQPSVELGFENFAESLLAHAMAHVHRPGGRRA